MVYKPGTEVKMSDRTYIVDRNGSLRVDSYHPENTRELPEFCDNVGEFIPPQSAPAQQN